LYTKYNYELGLNLLFKKFINYCKIGNFHAGKLPKMEIYPTSILSNENIPRSERIVFECFAMSENKNGYIAFHSINLPTHTSKFVGETDFVVLTTSGILIIEVKGSIVSLENRTWFQRTQRNRPKVIENPFSQAKGNMYAVKDMLEKAKLPFKYKTNLLGYGVIFPECKFEREGADVERAVLFDSRILQKVDPMRFVIGKLEKYWSSKTHKGVQKLKHENWLKLEKWFKPRYQSVPSLRAERNELGTRRVMLQKDQMNFLETASGKKRIVCQGGAGTGKTLVGLEYAKILELKGFKVKMLVPDNLFSYLKGREYQRDWLVKYQDLSELPDDSVEFLVVDESQDLMNLEDFSEIDRVLCGGLDAGSWLLLIDHQNQHGVTGKFDPDWLNTIFEYSDHDLVLPLNVRNTAAIIKSTMQLTGRDIGKKGTGEGPRTEWVRYKSIDDRNLQTRKIIEDLVESQLNIGEIVVVGLEKEPKDGTVAYGMKESGFKVTSFQHGNLADYPFNNLAYATSALIKGIEAYCVILDLGEFGVESLQKPVFYVAITRAKGRLILLCPRDIHGKVGEVMNNNVPLTI
jgi:hypothetical protein